MKLIGHQSQTARVLCAIAGIGWCLPAVTVLGADPAIHAEWGEPGDPPELDRDYRVVTSPPGSAEFPDVELITGSLTWRIWSTDSDNPNGIGDIGIISSPHPENFGVKIEDDLGGAGAREVKGIILDPQGEGSDAKYSNLTGGSITGDLSGNLSLQRAEGEQGEGGVASFTIDGGAQGDIRLHTVSDFSVGGEFSGTIVPYVIDGSLYIGGGLTGDGYIGVKEKIDGGALTVLGGVASTANIEIVKMVNASLSIASLSGDINVTQEMNGGEISVGVVASTASITIADMADAASLTFGAEGEPIAFSGDLALLTGVEQGATVTIYGPLTPVDEHTPTIDLKDQGVAGQLWISRAGDGDIINGGAVTGTVGLGEESTFSGTATFASVASQRYVKMCGADLGGTIHVTGSVDMDGMVAVNGNEQGGGKLLAGGRIQVDGEVSGYVRVAKEASGDIVLGGDIGANGKVWVGGDISGPVTVAGNVDGAILANAFVIGTGQITGPVTVGGEFNGNICGDNLSADEVLPDNIQLTFGDDGTVCGEAPCLLAATPITASGEAGYAKNRYISFEPGDAGASQPYDDVALRLTLTDLPAPFEGHEGEVMWVGQPREVSETSGVQDTTPPTFWAAELECDPYYTDWSGVDVLQAYGKAVIPGAMYTVNAIRERCNRDYGPNYSDGVTADTSIWGDIVGEWNGDEWTVPNGVVDPNDTAALVDKFKNVPGAPIKARADITGNLDNDNKAPDSLIDFVDISSHIDAYKGRDPSLWYEDWAACP